MEWERSCAGASRALQGLRLHLPVQRMQVPSLVRELRAHMSHSTPPPKEKKTKHKSNIVANSIKILKTVRTEDIFKRLQRVEWEWGE